MRGDATEPAFIQFTTIYAKKSKEKKPNILNFDVLDLLICLKEQIKEIVWFVKYLDYDGPDIPDGKLLTYQELVDCFGLCSQTIDGSLLGFRSQDISRENARSVFDRFDFLKFSRSDCQVVIRAVDSSFFEVYSKQVGIPDLLEAFFQVQKEGPESFF